MTKTNYVQAGGVAMLISGLALGYSYVSHPHHMPPDVIASTNWIIIHSLFALSLILGLIGTTALFASTAERVGWLGLSGFLLLFVGMMLIFGLDYYEVLIAPFLAVNYTDVIADHGAGDAMGPVAILFPMSGSLTVVGYALLAYDWKRIHALPSYIALFLLLTAIAFGVGLSPLGGIAVAQVTAAAFGLALMVTGGFAATRPQRFLATERARTPSEFVTSH